MELRSFVNFFYRSMIFGSLSSRLEWVTGQNLYSFCLFSPKIFQLICAKGIFRLKYKFFTKMPISLRKIQFLGRKSNFREKISIFAWKTLVLIQWFNWLWELHQQNFILSREEQEKVWIETIFGRVFPGQANILYILYIYNILYIHAYTTHADTFSQLQINIPPTNTRRQNQSRASIRFWLLLSVTGHNQFEMKQRWKSMRNTHTHSYLEWKPTLFLVGQWYTWI